MSALEKYSSYKDSGVEWLGNVPQHWEVVKLKYLMYEKKKVHNITLNCGSISFGKVVYKDDEKIPHSTKKAYQVVENGNFLVNPLNLNYDLKSLRIALSDLNVVVSSGYIVLDVLREINKTYLNYLLHRFDVAFMKTLGAGVRQTLNYTDISECELVEPPKEEQTKIANFLNEKTAQIDEAIKQKEKLISLLKERRQVLIHKAVTQGLNPTVKMKDSDIKWIGEIPNHWETTRFRYLFSFSKGLNITKENLQDKGMPCVNYGEIHSKYGFEVSPDKHNLKCVNEKYLKFSRKSILSYGDFVFADTSEDIDGSGNFTYLNSDKLTFAGYHTVITRAIKKINPRFFAYLFDSDNFRNQVRRKVKGVKVYSITNSILKDILIWIPPMLEQNSIVEELDIETEKIDKVLSFQENEITRLKEYKSSLIDSCVTGKVKVL